MSRLSDHHFTTTAPVFAFDDIDPFYDPADPASASPSLKIPITPFRAPECSNEENTNGNRR